MGIQSTNKYCFLLCSNKLFTVEVDNLFSQGSIDLSWNKLQKYWKKKREYTLFALIDVPFQQLKAYKSISNSLSSTMFCDLWKQFWNKWLMILSVLKMFLFLPYYILFFWTILKYFILVIHWIFWFRCLIQHSST